MNDEARIPPGPPADAGSVERAVADEAMTSLRWFANKLMDGSDNPDHRLQAMDMYGAYATKILREVSSGKRGGA